MKLPNIVIAPCGTGGLKLPQPNVEPCGVARLMLPGQFIQPCGVGGMVLPNIFTEECRQPNPYFEPYTVLPPTDVIVTVENEEQCADAVCAHPTFLNTALFILCDTDGNLFFVINPDPDPPSPWNLPLDPDGSLGEPFGLHTAGTYAAAGRVWCASGYWPSEVNQEDANNLARQAMADRVFFETFYNGAGVGCGPGTPTPCPDFTISNLADIDWKVSNGALPPSPADGSDGVTMTGTIGSFNQPFGMTFGRGTGGYYEAFALPWNHEDVCFQDGGTVTIVVNISASVNCLVTVRAAIQAPPTSPDDKQIIFDDTQYGPGIHTFTFSVPPTTPFAFAIGADAIDAPGTIAGTITISGP